MTLSTPAAPFPAPLHVLVVEDEPLIRWSVRNKLALRGHLVTDVGTGADAIDRVLACGGQFDVIVLDYRLPDRQDLSLLRDLRRLSGGSAIVMMSAFADDDVRVQALALGARAVVPKPFQVSALVDLIESAKSP